MKTNLRTDPIELTAVTKFSTSGWMHNRATGGGIGRVVVGELLPREALEKHCFVDVRWDRICAMAGLEVNPHPLHAIQYL